MTDIFTLTMNPAVDVSTSADRAVSEHKLRCSRPLRDPGGRGINVARLAARLGADVKPFIRAATRSTPCCAASSPPKASLVWRFMSRPD